MANVLRRAGSLAQPWGLGAHLHALSGALALPLLFALGLAAWSWWYLSLAPLSADETIAFGAVASAQLDGFYRAETTPEGFGMRWTKATAGLDLAPQGMGAHVLSLTLAAPRPEPTLVPVALSLNGAPLTRLAVGPERRHYRLLAPAAGVGLGATRLTIVSETFAPGRGDPRALGVAAFELRWRGLGAPGWLPAAQALAIGALAATLYALLRRAGIPLAARLLALALLLAILISMRHSDPRFAHRLGALALTCGLALLAGLGLLVARPQPGDGALPWRAWLGLHWPALAGYVALTVLMHLPIIASLGSRIPSYPGDSFEYLWKLQLFSDYLIERHQSPTFVSELLYPAGFELANSEITPANTLLGLPLTRLFGAIASFNLLNLASFVLSGFCTYLLIHRLGARRLAAFVGAIVFAFTIRRYHQLHSGHLPLMATQYLPLALYGLEGMLTRRRNWDAYVAALGLALATWASLYYGTTLAPFMAGYALLRLGLRRVGPWLAASWRQLALAAVLLLALTAPFAQPYLELREQGSGLRHGLIELQVHSARPADYLAPNQHHPLFGAWALQYYREDGTEHVVNFGYTAMLLAALGLWLARPRRLALALAALMAATFVLTLGPYLTLPGGALLPLPALFIYEHVPILDGIRVWNRVVLYLVLCAAILAGLALTAPRGRRYYGAALAAGALLLWELAAASPATYTGPRAVDRWLAAQVDRGAAIELPATPSPSGSQILYASYQGRPSNLWYGTFAPPLFVENRGLLEGFPSPEAVRLLQRWQTRYVVVDGYSLAARSPGWEAEADRLPGLSLRYREGGYSVYAVERGARR